MTVPRTIPSSRRSTAHRPPNSAAWFCSAQRVIRASASSSDSTTLGWVPSQRATSQREYVSRNRGASSRRQFRTTHRSVSNTASPVPLTVKVPSPREAEQPEARESDGDQHQHRRTERLLEQLVQRLVEPAGLLRVVGDRGVQEQHPDDRDRDALADVADLAEGEVGLAVLAGLALGVQVGVEPLAPAAEHQGAGPGAPSWGRTPPPPPRTTGARATTRMLTPTTRIRRGPGARPTPFGVIPWVPPPREEEPIAVRSAVNPRQP